MQAIKSQAVGAAHHAPPQDRTEVARQFVGERASIDVGGGGHDDGAADLHERHEQWLREQYLRDLQTLDRIERQREGEQDCFFTAMGAIARARGGNAA